MSISPGRNATPVLEQLARRALSAPSRRSRISSSVTSRGAMPALRGSSRKERVYDGIGNRLAAFADGFVVFEEAGHRLLPRRFISTSRSMHVVRPSASASPCAFCMCQTRRRVPKDRSSQTVPSGSRSLGMTASTRERARRPPRRVAIASRSVVEDHAVADETERVAREHGRLAQRLAEFERGRQRLRRRSSHRARSRAAA